MNLFEQNKGVGLSNKVLVYNTSPNTLEKDIEKVLEASALAKYYDRKRKTLIKINANYDRNYPGCNTSIWFLDALLAALRKLAFTDLIVVEGDLKLQPAEKTLQVIGIKEVLRKHGVPFINLENCPRGEDELPLLVHDSQMINVPVIHTHIFAVISCASKNLFGILPVYREKYHNELSEKLLELVARINPCFTVVDGTVGLEGGSMRMGTPKRLDLILAGWNPLAIDLVAAKIMGFCVEEVPLLNLVKVKNLVKEIALDGDYTFESLPNFNFKYKTSKIARLDLWLRGSLFTPLFEFNSFFDKSAQRVRRMLLSMHYAVKRKRILNGPWMEYYKAYSSDGDNENTCGNRNKPS